jgi:hypothetical protein
MERNWELWKENKGKISQCKRVFNTTVFENRLLFLYGHLKHDCIFNKRRNKTNNLKER